MQDVSQHGAARARKTCLEISALSKTYQSSRGSIAALREFDLEVAEGEFVSILGPSGCGKSTLLRCIGGLSRFDAGAIRIRGNAVTGPILNAGVVFQRDLLLDWRTVLQNVLLSVEYRQGRRADWTRKAQALLEKVGLGHMSDRYPWELSGGMRQRAAICRALLPEPQILLMDEPFGALDAMTRDNLNAQLQRVWLEQRQTAVLITHSIEEAVFLSDRIVIMTPTPGAVLDVVTIAADRPRTESFRETPEFTQTSSSIRRMFAEMGALK